MLHFNELSISEDGKYLLIDVSVDDIVIYKNAGVYIYRIFVDLADNSVTGDVSDKAVEVFPGRFGSNLSRFDVNRDGAVNRDDVTAIQDAIIAGSHDMDTYDLNYDNEISNVDAQLLNDYFGVIGDDGRHVRLCLNIKTDLVTLGLNNAGDHMFLIRAEAGYDSEHIDNLAKMDCGGWDTDYIVGVVFDKRPLYDAAVRYAKALGDRCDDSALLAFEDFILQYYSFVYALKCDDLASAKKYYKYLRGTGPSGSVSSKCGCHGVR